MLETATHMFLVGLLEEASLKHLQCRQTVRIVLKTNPFRLKHTFELELFIWLVQIWDAFSL